MLSVTVAACRYAKRGVRGLFHGFAITSFSGVAVNAASIASYLYLRDAFMDKFNLDIRSAGAASGAMTELFVAPFAIPSQVVSQVQFQHITMHELSSSLILVIFSACENRALGFKRAKRFWSDSRSVQVYIQVRRLQRVLQRYDSSLFVCDTFVCGLSVRTFSCFLPGARCLLIWHNSCFLAGTAASLWFNAPSQALAWGSYEGFKILCAAPS